jgi:hypothetical protein
LTAVRGAAHRLRRHAGQVRGEGGWPASEGAPRARRWRAARRGSGSVSRSGPRRRQSSLRRREAPVHHRLTDPH